MKANCLKCVVSKERYIFQIDEIAGLQSFVDFLWCGTGQKLEVEEN